MHRRALPLAFPVLAFALGSLAAVPAARAASPAPLLARWTSIAPLPSTSIRGVFDPVAHRMIVIPEGAVGGGARVWALDTQDPAAGWAPILTQGTPPPGRTAAVVVLDPTRRQVIVWGGYSFTPGVMPHFDVLDLKTEPPTWSSHTGSGPAPRILRDTRAVYDGLRDRIVFFGGAYDSVGAHFRNDVWTLTLGPNPWWTPLVVPGEAPSPRCDGAAIYDALRDRLVIHGGMDVTFGGPRSDAWALDFTGPMHWTRLWQGAGGHDGQRSHHGFYDELGDRMLLSGGTDSSSGINNNYHDEVRALSLATAGPPVVIADEAGAPHNMGTFAAVFDRDVRAIFTLGDEHNPTVKAVTWRLDLAGTAAWTRVLGEDTSVRERFGTAQAWDAAGQRMIFTGGRHAQYAHFSFWNTYYDETRSLTLDDRPQWGSLDAGGFRPPSRQYATLLADPPADRMWLFGGNHTTTDYPSYVSIEVFANLWCLELGGPAPVWTSPSVEGLSPSSRDGHTAVLDTRRHRMLVFGGRSGWPTNDVWALSLDAPHAWTPVEPAGTLPRPRFFHVAGYDSLEDRMLVYGGIDENLNSTSDLWALSLSETPTWSPLATAGTPPATWNARPGFFDPVRRRMVVIGKGVGNQSPAAVTPVFVLSFDQPVPYWSEIPSAGDVDADQTGRSAAIDPVSGEIALLWGAASREPATYVEPLPHRITFDEVPAPTAVPVAAPSASVALEATPNPARSSFRIRAALPSAEPVTVEVVDAAGRAWRTQRLAATGGHVDVAFTTEGLAPGLYFVCVAQAAERATRKLVVVR